MPQHIFSNAKVWLDGYDLSGYLNAVVLDNGVELHNTNVLGDTGRRRISNQMEHIAAQLDGFWDSTADEILQGRVGVADKPMSVSPSDGTDGSLAYFFRSLAGEYESGGAKGDPYRFSVSAEGSAGEPLVRGTVLHNATRTANGSGTGFNLGQLAAGKKLYAALHVLSVSSGDNLTVTIESDDNAGFASPTVRGTFTVMSAIGAAWLTPVAGPLTDTYWRAAYTLGGDGSPSINFVVVLGFK